MTPAPRPLAPSASRFFLLLILLSVPFYILGATGSRLMGLPILPSSALMTFAPMTAALLLVWRQRGPEGALALVAGAFNFRRHRRAGWYLTAVLFMPVVCAIEFGVLRWSGSAVPIPRIPPGEVLFLLLAFFVGAIGEEVGWQGCAYPAMRRRLGVLASAAALGTAWALWHVVPLVQLGRNAEWIVWHSLSAVALRVIIVWLFENTGRSVFIAVVFHTMINVSWALFPNSGSYDPFARFVILTLAVGLILSIWGPTTLARFRWRSNISAP